MLALFVHGHSAHTTHMEPQTSHVEIIFEIQGRRCPASLGGPGPPDPPADPLTLPTTKNGFLIGKRGCQKVTIRSPSAMLGRGGVRTP